MPGIKSILKQSSIYSTTQVLLLMFSLITFPIFTRLLSKEEYGLLNIVTITLTMVTLLCSGDLKDAILRFYGECEGKDEIRILISNTFTGSLLISMVGYLLSVVAAFVLFELRLIPNNVFKIIVISFLAIIARNVLTPIQTFYRVREEALKYNAISFISKLLTTTLCIIFVAYLSKGLYGLFIGQTVGEGIVAIVLLFLFLKKYGLAILSISAQHLKIFLKYSLPLVVNGIFVYLSNFGDRYLIALFLDQSSVATYVVAYVLPDYLQTAIILSLNMVLYPAIMNLWGKGRDQEADVMLSNFLIIYIVIAIPIIFGLFSVRYEIIEVLASKKYLQSAELIAVLTLGIMMKGLYFPLAAGLYKEKKTKLIALVNVAGVFINVVLNIVLIPVLGLKGAAFATFVSYFGVLVISYRLSNRYKKINMDFKKVASFTAIAITISLVMFLVLNFINVKPLGLICGLICKILVGILIYCGGVLIFIKRVRKQSEKLFGRT